MAFLPRLAESLIGVGEDVPRPLLERYPELALLELRRGGLPPRLGGWCLGRRSVAGITIGRRVWLSPGVAPSVELLLHELRHVHQFQAFSVFPLRYWWESLRRGYRRNRFEIDARHFVSARLNGPPPTDPQPEDSYPWSSTPPLR
jgi:hypothetical protein